MAGGLSDKRVCVTGGAGFLGRAVCAKLQEAGAGQLFVPRSREFDLTDPQAVGRMFDAASPQIVIHLAAEVGGIGANQQRPGRFFYANMAMGLHLIEESRRRGVEKFVQIGTVCSYPKWCPVPFREADLWSGYPEETNAPYGVAKRALAVMLDAYRREYGFTGIYLIPTNLYGPGDNFDKDTSHVIPALIRRFSEAKAAGNPRAVCWGTGQASREFLYVDDAAEAIVLAAGHCDDPAPVNLGSGQEITIAELAHMVAKLCGFSGSIDWDHSRPDGQARRQVDSARASATLGKLGWRPRVGLADGLRRTIDWWQSDGKNAAPTV